MFSKLGVTLMTSKDRHPTGLGCATHRLDDSEVNISGSYPTLNHASRDINVTIYQSLVPKGFELLLGHVATGALHSSREVSDAPKCYPGTRVAIRDTIFHWATASVYIICIQWVYGAAGSGKSTLLRTIAEVLNQHGLLLASFFFCGTADRRDNANYFIPTIAYQIARSIPATRAHIERAIENDPLIFHQSPDAQVEALIVHPITQAYREGGIGKGYPRIIIVDGIDECKGEREQQQVLRVLNKMLMVPIPIAFLVASRPKTHIVATFDADLGESCTRLALENFDEADKEDRITPDDVVIGVLGPTGSGKSTFISRVSERNMGVGHSLQSCTREMKMVRFSSPALTDSKIVLVDTPGFDHTDTDISAMISDWLSETCGEKISLAGLLYFHPISARRATGPPLRNLNIVQELRRKGMLKNVILVTTMWDQAGDKWGATREGHLLEHYWKGLDIQSPKTYHYLRDARSAYLILEPLVEAANVRNAKVLKEEMAGIDRFRQALAGKTRSQQILSFPRVPVHQLSGPRLNGGWGEVTLDAGRGVGVNKLAESVEGVDDRGGGGSGVRPNGVPGKQWMRTGTQREINRHELELQAASAGQTLYTQLGSLVTVREDFLKRMREQLSRLDQNGATDRENALLNELEDLKKNLEDILREIEKLRLPLGDWLKMAIRTTISMKQFVG